MKRRIIMIRKILLAMISGVMLCACGGGGISGRITGGS